jgi:2',3'-cyclic-nucleotide 2'-phosphodiesterase (5'-nucleotidase family)
MLERCTAIVPEEDGSFPQVSGMKYTIHKGSHTISDVQVLDASTGEYLPLDVNRKYTIGTTDYYKSGGFYGVLSQCRLIKTTTQLSRDALSDFLEKTLEGKTEDVYEKPLGRIIIVDD